MQHILNEKEYNDLLRCCTPAGLNKQYEHLTAAHAELHRTTSVEQKAMLKDLKRLREDLYNARAETELLELRLKQYES